MTQFRALSIKLEGKCSYIICVHKTSNAMHRKCLTLTKGIYLTIFGQCNRKLSSTSNLFNSNSTKNINFLQNKRCKAHFKKEKKIFLNLPTGMYKLKNYLPIKTLTVNYLFPLKPTLLNVIFPYCSANYLNLGEEVCRGIWQNPRTSCEVEVFLWITETKEKPVAF